MASKAATVAALSMGAAALVAIGAGTGAVAATQITGAQIKDGTVTGADIKNDSLRGADVLNGSLTGSDIKNGTVGKTDLAAGVLPRGYSAYDPFFTNLPSGAGTTTVIELPLPKGTYLISASGGVNNNDVEAGGNRTVTCSIVAGSSSVVLATNFTLGANGAVGETQWGAASTVATLPAAGTARIECVRTAAWLAGNVVRPSITAVSVQPGTTTLSVASADGDPNG